MLNLNVLKYMFFQVPPMVARPPLLPRRRVALKGRGPWAWMASGHAVVSYPALARSSVSPRSQE